MKSSRTFVAIVALFLAIACVLSAVAQTSKGIIAGIARDKTDAVVSGAKITVTSQETSETRAVIADERGAYRIDAVNPGHYTVNVTAGSFETANIREISMCCLPS
jgi:hypothetical protein